MRYTNFLLFAALLLIHSKTFGQYGYDYECIISPFEMPCTDSTITPICDDCHNDLSDNAQDILQISCEEWMNDPICRDVPKEKKIDCQNLREQKPSITGTYTITHLNTSPFIDRFTVDLKNNPPVRFEKINDPKRSIRSALDPPDFLDIARSCRSGVSAAIYNMANFFQESITSKYNFATNTDYREETIDETLEYINQATLYFSTEYARNYENASVLEQLMQLTPNIKIDPVLIRTAWAIGMDMLNKVGELIREETEKTQCMKTEAQAEMICALLSELFIPPISAVALLKYGKSAIKVFPNLQKAFPNLNKLTIPDTRRVAIILNKTDLTPQERQAINQTRDIGSRQPRRNSTPAERRNFIRNQREEQARILEEAGFDRMQRAAIMLGRPLDNKIRNAIQEAHEVGRGQPGRDGTSARVGNYTDAQLREKARILDEAGLNRDERRLLVEAGIVGDINKIEIQKFFLAQTLGITEEGNISTFLPDAGDNEIADFFKQRLGLSPSIVQKVLNESNAEDEIEERLIKEARKAIENYIKKENLKKILGTNTDEGLRRSLRDELGRHEFDNINRFIAGENPSEAIRRFIKKTENNRQKEHLKKILEIKTDDDLRDHLNSRLPNSERENIEKFIAGENPSEAIKNVIENNGSYMPRNNRDRARQVREATEDQLTENKIKTTTDRLNNMSERELQNSIQKHFKVDDRFVRTLNDPQEIPRNIKSLFIRMIARFEEEGWEKAINYPGLDFTPLWSSGYYRIKLGDHHRLILRTSETGYTLFRIMSHEEYNRFMRSLR